MHTCASGCAFHVILVLAYQQAAGLVGVHTCASGRAFHIIFQPLADALRPKSLKLGPSAKMSPSENFTTLSAFGGQLLINLTREYDDGCRRMPVSAE